MCLGLPGKIKTICGNTAVADFLGAEREIAIDFVKDAKQGDYVLVHAGCAIQILGETEAEETISLFEDLRELSDEGRK
ncbi:MAG: HypC/HybG/HupF family hydrogenase formation chaperone [Clostridiales bacterium]|nr:HypC/HybG/HupF family hydrogenase formation chaperone [Clostridiales bacterium]